jgi:hypothetical protein
VSDDNELNVRRDVIGSPMVNPPSDSVGRGGHTKPLSWRVLCDEVVRLN